MTHLGAVTAGSATYTCQESGCNSTQSGPNNGPEVPACFFYAVDISYPVDTFYAVDIFNAVDSRYKL